MILRNKLLKVPEKSELLPLIIIVVITPNARYPSCSHTENDTELVIEEKSKSNFSDNAEKHVINIPIVGILIARIAICRRTWFSLRKS
jgi:hypothetical protein